MSASSNVLESLLAGEVSPGAVVDDEDARGKEEAISNPISHEHHLHNTQ